MRKWRVVAVAATLVAAGVAVPLAYAVTNNGPDLSTLPRPQRSPGADPAQTTPTDAVVKLTEGAPTSAITSRGARVLGDIPGTGYLRVRPAGDVGALVTALEQDPTVVQAAPDFARQLTATPSDPLYGPYQQPYLSAVRAPEAWDRVNNAGGQVVAVIDTGVDATQPDLAGRVLPGYNAVDPGASSTDIEGHGTFVAGIIAANPNNGAGVAGIAWNATILPVQVFTGDEAYDSDIAEGIYWAVDHGATVINLSLGGPGYSPLLYDSVQYAVAHQVVVVAASGNTGNSIPQYPAAFPEVLAVGATDAAGHLTDFSSYGDWLDLAAPGFDIVSTAPGGYAIGDGTSFAAPIVAGVAALVRKQNPQLTGQDVADRLRATARDAGPRGIDPYYGYGLLDAARALGAPAAAELALPALGAGEPNDDAGRATTLTGSGALSAAGTFGVEGDADWYRFDSAAAREVTVTVTPASYDGNRGQNADPVLEVYNAGLQLIAIEDEWAGGHGETATILVQAGVSYVRVRDYSGAADTRPYALTVTPTTAAPFYQEKISLPRLPDLYDPSTLDAFEVSALAVGDVTHDTLPDLVLAGWVYHPAYQNDVVVLPGTPGGGFDAPLLYPTGGIYTTSLALLDINQDGRLDVALRVDGVLRALLQQSDGTLGGSSLLGVTLTGDQARTLVAADIDDDGDTDLVVGTVNDCLLLLTHGAGSTFTVTTAVSSDLGNIFALGDVTGDGHPDVVSSGRRYGYLRVYDGGSAWAPTDYALAGGSWATGITIADATGDGRADVTAGVDNRLLVLAQKADGTLDTPVARGVVANAEGIAAADIDGDHLIDLAVDHSGYASIGLHLQQADHTLAPEQVVTMSKEGFNDFENSRLAAADLDGDGRAEVIVGGNPLTVLRREAPPILPELVASVTPAEYSTGVAASAAPTVGFVSDVNQSTVDSGTVRLLDGRTGAVVPANVVYDAGSHSATIDPVAALDKAKPYRIVVDGVASLTGEYPLRPFTSTFVTANGPLPALTDVHLTGHGGTSVRALLTVPVGDLGEIIIRGTPGTTAPASPTAGSIAYSGVDPSPLVTGLTPGQTYSFALWYRDRSGVLSAAPVTATLHGATLSMGLASGTSTVTTTQPLTFSTSLTSPTGTTTGQQVALMALCRGSTRAWQTVTTGTTNGAGTTAVASTQTRPSCDYHWDFTREGWMGATSGPVTVLSTLTVPTTPPRTR